MYSSRRQDHSRDKHGNNSYAFRGPRVQRNTQKHVKKLDPNLFVKRANGVCMPVEQSSGAHFSEYNVVDKLKCSIRDHGYSVPTEIQEKSIPLIISGRDIIGIVGSNKKSI